MTHTTSVARKRLKPAEAKARRKRRDPAPKVLGAIRLTAETLYVSGTESLAALHERHRDLQVVTLRTLERYSAEGDWPNKRRQHQDDVAKLTRATLSSDLAAERVDEIRALAAIRENVIDILRDGELVPTTHGGAVNALVKLTRAIEELRCETEVRLPAPGPQVGGSTHQIKPNLSQKEAHAAAMAVIRLRQAKLREEAEKSKESPSDERS